MELAKRRTSRFWFISCTVGNRGGKGRGGGVGGKKADGVRQGKRSSNAPHTPNHQEKGARHR